ncbi:hypothetical protein E4U53_002924 [Claviceps sorghi]|nr:hypothetical protein E4U53_002924 [Claviceps sorghi]
MMRGAASLASRPTAGGSSDQPSTAAGGSTVPDQTRQDHSSSSANTSSIPRVGDSPCATSQASAVSYADVAASGIKQTPEEAAAPRPVELVNNEPTSTASLVGVSTVPADYLEQSETQAGRLEREAETAKDKAQNAKKQTAKKARQTDSWIVQHFASLSDGSAGVLAFTNFAAVIGVSSYLGYRAWGLYERGQLNWEKAGVGLGILAGVGAAEAVFGRYLYKGKKGGS